MVNMLKLHFYYSRKALALLGFFMFVIIGFLHYFFEQNFLNMFSFIFLLQVTLFSISFYKENHFIRILRTMPIAIKDFVTSAYVYSFILIAVIGLPFIVYLFYQNPLTGEERYVPYVFVGLFAVCLVHTGGQLKQYFANPTKTKIHFGLTNLVWLLLVLFLPHGLILVCFNVFFSIELGGLIIPIISLWIYYRLCQTAITKFEKVEL